MGCLLLDFSVLMNWVFGIFGVGGTLFSLITEWRRRKTERENKSLSWEELMAGTTDLFKDIRSNFDPEVILTPNLRGGIIAHLIIDQFDRHIPAFVGQIFWKKSGGEVKPIPSHFKIATGKWELFIPEAIIEFKDSRLLIVDDFSMSGDTLANVKDELILRGFNPELIKTASLVTTKVAVDNNKSTDFRWRVNENNDFYFPWGKAK